MVFTVGLVYLCYVAVRLVLGTSTLVPGWSSLIILNCLGSGTILLSIGVLGEYIARIFEEMKGRPMYVVSDYYNVEHDAAPELTPAVKERSIPTGSQ